MVIKTIKTNNKLKKIIGIFVIVALLFSSYGFGWLMGSGNRIIFKGGVPNIINKDSETEKEIDFKLFWNVWDIINNKYYGDADQQKMFYGAISGMVGALGDPYTIFLTPEEATKFNDEMKGSFEGIGAELGMKNDKLSIIAPLDGSPAQKAGLRAGDIILKINDEDTTGMSLNDAVSKIRGAKGTEVKLLISREGADQKEYKIVRDTIEVKSVSFEMKDGLAYLKIKSFNDETMNEFNAIKSDLLSKNPNGIILDMRGNPGGYLDKAIEFASEFIDKGAITWEQFKDGSKKEYSSKGGGSLTKFKVVVLVDNGSASAAEIVAGALRDQKDAKLVGEKTYGKGSVQELQELLGGAALKVTIAHWLTPNGDSINEKGLEPDLKIELSNDDFNKGKDPQLDKAIELLK